ncbi:methyltransferase, FkbM family domain protein [Burkholderia sp. MSHR3999]|uniref:FkbM family methyltransferase n=1 Tax=Burkholderia sp. MSHR3999 TaxID=1542965 RepID=UPI0005B70130|nr:FkbM family methyltransferase [Burkholderia sp. MSHR3999]KIP17174.1 methyltransferase, FkbM family domain protein [Burkholderia sp. MSHR3999]
MSVSSQMAQIADPYVLVEARHGTMLANRYDYYIGQALIEYGEYCELETQFLKRWIDRPGTVIEVGANVGSQTVALAKAAKTVGADVITFEPQPFVFQNLCANLALNAVDNVTAWPFACAMRAGALWLAAPNYRQQGNFGAVSVRADVIEGGIQVPCVRLDDMIPAREVCLMKVDVEGFELQVLQGARETLSKNRPIVYIENDRLAQSYALVEYLWELGYRLWWHITPLFNPLNFRGRTDNRYQNLSAFNMIGLPRESSATLDDCDEIVDATFHPLVARRT